jgi:hypothetical protein
LVGWLVVVALALVAWQYQWLVDQYTLLTYRAPANVAALEQPLALTSKAQAILDRARPQIDSKAQFNTDCQTSAGDLELGCFNHNRIYVLLIDNDSLKPEMETVLAHELLHAAWARLDANQQRTLGTQLEAVYEGLHDSDLQQRMAGYAQTEPGEQDNELHSILGTEQTTLTPVLEQYYSQYFTSRTAIVAAHAAYAQVFAGRGQELATQLATIKSLKSQLSSLNGRMSSLKASGMIAQYNALVPQQNALVEQVNGLISGYNAGVDEYNALSNSIDSHKIDTEPGV